MEPRVLSCFIFLLRDSLFPEIGFLDTPRLRVKSVCFDTGGFLFLIVAQCPDRGFGGQEYYEKSGHPRL
jgi:hypothetical protein